MEHAAAHFLRAIRGDRSQVAFARRLGYRGNPITDWEHGRRSPTAREAMRACARVGIDVEGAFARFQPTVPLTTGPEGAAIGDWLDRLRGGTPIVELAARAGFSRFAVSRFLRGGAQPRVAELFRLVDAITGRLPDLVAELVPIAAVPELAARHAAARAARTLALDEPWTEAILRVLETEDARTRPRHEPGFVAARLGIDPAVEKRCLARLREAGVISRRRGRWIPIGALTVDTRATPAAMNALRAHWAGVSLGRAAAPGTLDSFSYNVCSLSWADRERVREIMRATFREIRSIVAASEPSESVALLVLHLVAFDEQ